MSNHVYFNTVCVYHPSLKVKLETSSSLYRGPGCGTLTSNIDFKKCLCGISLLLFLPNVSHHLSEMLISCVIIVLENCRMLLGFLSPVISKKINYFTVSIVWPTYNVCSLLQGLSYLSMYVLRVISLLQLFDQVWARILICFHPRQCPCRGSGWGTLMSCVAFNKWLCGTSLFLILPNVSHHM